MAVTCRVLVIGLILVLAPRIATPQQATSLTREQMEAFYAEQDGWYQERLTRSDMMLTEWRKLASRHGRGLQRRGLRRGTPSPRPLP